jgi:hypothetical protein
VPTPSRAALPRAALLTLWGNAHLRGSASLDDAAAHAVGADALHRVVGVPGEDGDVPIGIALARLRLSRVEALRVVLPEPGDPTGMPGPAAFNVDAVAAGEAVITVSRPGAPALALVPAVAPSEGGDVVRWDVVEVGPSAHPHGLPTLSEAERQLAESLIEATEALAALDLARGREEVAGRLQSLERRVSRLDLPGSLSPRAQRAVVQAARLLAILEIAASTPGAEVTAGEAQAREATLRPLRRAARHALCAACSAEAEPAHEPAPGPKAWRR